MSKTIGTHPCPGCGDQVLALMLCCRPCYERLPRPERDNLVRGWTRDATALGFTVGRLVTWLQAHHR